MAALISNSLIRPAIFKAFPQVTAGISTRQGGVSQPPFASLNLSNIGPDSEVSRNENRRRFCATLGFSPDDLVRSVQVHGTEILHATTGGLYDGYDAMITQQPQLLLAASVADCTPILVYDRQTHAVAAVHAGWKGTVAHILSKTLLQMQENYGTKGRDCYAYIGPCIGADYFEVGEEVAAQFEAPFKNWNSTKNKFFVDLKMANAAQLRAFGLPAQQIETTHYCTVQHNAHFFSYRQEQGSTGRMLAAIARIS